MRTYMVVIDETEEASIAVRFAARRAAKTGSKIQILVVVSPVEFVQWGGVQATIEDEARQRAEELVHKASGTLIADAGINPEIIVRQGDPVSIVRAILADNPDVAALVLGAAPSGAPGPLVSYFTGHDAGQLPCPIMIIPGSLSTQALDRLS